MVEVTVCHGGCEARIEDAPGLLLSDMVGVLDPIKKKRAS